MPAPTPEIIAEAFKRFQVEVVAPLDSWVENRVYECIQNGKPVILKIAPCSRTSRVELEGEFEFTRFLAAHNIPVAQPLPSPTGEWIVSLDGGPPGEFLAYLVEKTPGTVLPDEDEIHLPGDKLDHLLVEWGRLTGRLHRVARSYHPSHPKYKRMEWDEEHTVWDVDRHLPVNQAIVKEKVRSLFKKFQALPKNESSYGLVHADLHHGNFSIDEGGHLTLFDFGACMYSWYILDIAIALYNALPYPPARVDERRAFAPRFLQPFLQGYLSENYLEPEWLALIPDFLKYEYMASYILYHQAWDLNNLSEKRAALLQRYRYDIENDTPLVDFDFADWVKHCEQYTQPRP